jgi:hypothetical protein
LDFESEKLEATRNVHNPGLRLIERYAEVFENPHRSGQGVLRLGPSPTGHYPVIRPSRELVPVIGGACGCYCFGIARSISPGPLP